LLLRIQKFSDKEDSGGDRLFGADSTINLKKPHIPTHFTRHNPSFEQKSSLWDFDVNPFLAGNRPFVKSLKNPPHLDSCDKLFQKTKAQVIGCYQALHSIPEV
jgi:hypothetical protein